MPDIAMRMAGVSLSFALEHERVEVLRSLDLQAKRGEALALVGPSGSGKSSLLMLLAGLERPDSGQIDVLGQDILQMNESALAKLRRDHIGFVFQSFHLIPTMTALDNVATALDLAGRDAPRETARRELAAVGLGARLRHHPAELSGGEQQRVAIARAVSTSPSLILADEPTGNLDESTGGEIADLLFEVAARCGSTLMLATHDMELAARTDRVLRLQGGRISDG